MKFDDYKNMKNFSEQQNFAVPAFLKNAGAYAMKGVNAAKEGLQNLGKATFNPGKADLRKAKVANAVDGAVDSVIAANAADRLAIGIRDGHDPSIIRGLANLGALGAKKVANSFGVYGPIQKIANKAKAAGDAKNLAAGAGIVGAGTGALGAGAALLKAHGDKTLKGAEGVFQKIGSKFTEGKGFFGSTRAAQQAKLGKMIAGGTAIGALGTGASIYALAGSGAVDPAKYYIFDGESGKPLSDGFATKDEALAVRNQNFPGARINRGNTLMQKAG